MRAVVRSIVAAGLLGGVVLAVPVSPVGADRPRPHVPTLDWQPCGDDFPAASAPRPRCRSTTTGRAGRRRRSRSRASRRPTTGERIGSVFVNPGGPGGSGVGLVLGGFGEFLHGSLGGRFDVVGFDPRGVGASDPLHCFDSEDDLFEFLTAAPVFPYASGPVPPFYDHYASLADRCLTRGETIAEHMSTADVVRDLDLLRRAVGDNKLTYLGFSYGSYIGNTYANLFPKNMRALVIDGVLDPRLWSSGWQINSDRVATQEEFDEFLRLCDEAGDRCAFASGDDTAERWEALAAPSRTSRSTSATASCTPTTSSSRMPPGAMYQPEVWAGPDGFGTFLDFLADAALGDQSAAAQARATRRSFVEKVASCRPQQEADYDNGLDAYFGNQCADTEYPSTSWPSARLTCTPRAGSPLRPLLVVVQQRLRRLAGRPRPLRRAVADAHVGARPRRRQLLRRRHRPRRRRGYQPAARGTAGSSATPAGATRRTAAASARPTSSTPTCSTAACRPRAPSARPIRTRSSRSRPEQRAELRRWSACRPSCRRGADPARYRTPR